MLAVDFASYTKTVYPPALRRGSVPFAIVKSSSGNREDYLFSKHLDVLNKDNYPYAIYHWCDPTVSPETNVETILKVIEKSSPLFIALDFEQWWSNWGTWLQAIRNKIPLSSVGRISPTDLRKHFETLVTKLESKIQKPIVIYTSEGFISSYVDLGIVDFFSTRNLWVASYYAKYNIAEQISWDALHYPAFNELSLKLFSKQNVVGWQFTGDKKLVPGLSSRADINIFSSSFVESLGVEDNYSENVIGTGTVLASALNFRASPEIANNKLTSLPKGSKVSVYKVDGDWVDTNWGWCYGKYLRIDLVNEFPKNCRPESLEELLDFMEKNMGIRWCE